MNTIHPALPPLLTRFVDSMNAHDSTAFIPCFAPDAVVEDEGRTHRGTQEIRTWIEESFKTARPVLEVTGVATTETSAVITGPVSGTFPGSPIVLNFHLTLAGDKITALKCTV